MPQHPLSPDTLPAPTGRPTANAKTGDVQPDEDGNHASTLIEAPEKAAQPGGPTLKRHDFPDGGGSGGAEAFRRKD